MCRRTCRKDMLPTMAAVVFLISGGVTPSPAQNYQRGGNATTTPTYAPPRIEQEAQRRAELEEAQRRAELEKRKQALQQELARKQKELTAAQQRQAQQEAQRRAQIEVQKQALQQELARKQREQAAAQQRQAQMEQQRKAQLETRKQALQQELARKQKELTAAQQRQAQQQEIQRRTQQEAQRKAQLKAQEQQQRVQQEQQRLAKQKADEQKKLELAKQKADEQQRVGNPALCPNLTGAARTNCLNAELRRSQQESARARQNVRNLDRAIGVVQAVDKAAGAVAVGAGAAAGAAAGSALDGPGGAVVGKAAGAKAGQAAYGTAGAIGNSLAPAIAKKQETDYLFGSTQGERARYDQKMAQAKADAKAAKDAQAKGDNQQADALRKSATKNLADAQEIRANAVRREQAKNEGVDAQFYGNYCGKGLTGGASGKSKPINNIDAACEKHDGQYKIVDQMRKQADALDKSPVANSTPMGLPGASRLRKEADAIKKRADENLVLELKDISKKKELGGTSFYGDVDKDMKFADCAAKYFSSDAIGMLNCSGETANEAIQFNLAR